MVKIFADSTCDLTAKICEQYDITIIPLHICLEEREYRDGLEITPEDIYKWADASGTTPKTSAPSVSDAVEAFREALKAGDEIIAFTISAKMSTSFNVLKLAAQELDAEERVTVIDSMNLSTGIGLLVVQAAVYAKRGMDRDKIAQRIYDLIPRVRASFVVDTLVYLHRGGRCTAVAALAGGVLKLHPKIVVVDGAMDASTKYRGKIDSVIMKYVEDMTDELHHAVADRVFITHSGCDPATVEAVRNYLAGLGIFEEILETRAGGVVSSHCGPGTLGVLFIAGEE